MSKVETIVTEKFIEALENGVCPWQKPWKAGSVPVNMVSKKAYRGINLFLLSLSPYSSSFWGTYKQVAAKGGNVKKGEKSTLIIFWKMLISKDKKTGDKKTVPMLRYYNVFNADQCEGLDLDEGASEGLDFNPIEAAEDLAFDFADRENVALKFQGNAACYVPSLDEVRMPSKETFVSEGAYYSTLFHEFAHSTGHSSRLNRLDNSSFGSDPYAKEELIAELSAAFVCADLGIDNTFDNSAAYLQSWIKKLKGDSTLLISASSKAAKAFQLIKGASVPAEV